MDIYDESIGVEIKLALAMAKLSDCESALAERDKPCKWEYKRYGGWFTTCEVRPEIWNAAWDYCPFCGHPIEVAP